MTIDNESLKLGETEIEVLEKTYYMLKKIRLVEMYKINKK